MHLFKHVFGVVLVGFLVGCASLKQGESFQTRIYEGSYDQVWLSVLKSLNDYPLRISNKDNGKIQSEVVNGPYNDLLFTSPEPVEVPERFRFSVRLGLASLDTDSKHPTVRVRVTKDLERFVDFYTGWLPFPSDGLEEKVLLYRISHVLAMEKALAKLTKEQTTTH